MSGEAVTLDGAVVVVTGATRGIGEATALEFARHGASVVLVGRSTRERPDPEFPGTLDDTAAEIESLGGKALTVQANLADHESAQLVHDETVDRFGRCDVLVNNAAVQFLGPFLELEPKSWDTLMSLNVRTPMLLSQLFLPSMIGRGFGRIINITSAAGRVDFNPTQTLGTMFGEEVQGDHRVAYGSSKAALNRLTVGIAREVAGTGVSANALEVVAVSPVFRKVRPDLDVRAFELPEAPAQLVTWLARQPAELSGTIFSQDELLATLRADGSIRPKVDPT